jgi:predicted glycosyltransferase
MVGFGHIRRNATIAQALRNSPLQPAIVMIAEAWQAGALPMPAGVDCVTLPALRKDGDGCCAPRFLGVREQDLSALRASVIRSAMDAFQPDALIVDHLPLGAVRELVPTLAHLTSRGKTRCVLGMRDVLQDRKTVRQSWSEPGVARAVRDHYHAIWVYGDPLVHDPVRDSKHLMALAQRVRYAGYLDQRPRLELATAEVAPLLASLPPGRLVLCDVGGGQDGNALTEAFVQARMPAGTTGVAVTGPYMSPELKEHVRQHARRHPSMVVLDFVPDLAPLIHRADRVIAMGGYNTVCEVLSFEKHALIVPRVSPKPEQWIRAQRMQQLGLLDVLHPDDLSPAALSAWLARDPGPRPSPRSRVDLGGLSRIPTFLAELLGVARRPRRRGVTHDASALTSRASISVPRLPLAAAVRAG